MKHSNNIDLSNSNFKTLIISVNLMFSLDLIVISQNLCDSIIVQEPVFHYRSETQKETYVIPSGSTNVNKFF